MAGRFDYFVVYAEMRTGSNFLEENINEYPGLTCYGEAFNPVFMGGANKTEMLGVTLAQRESNPYQLLDRMLVHTDGLPGFRFFHDHDPRILERTLTDPRCAKIILTRNPIDSYVSRKIASATGQWRLNDLKNAKTAKIEFVRDEFEEHLDRLQTFQRTLLNGLQTTGQTAFYIAYEDVGDVQVMNGLAKFLGVDHHQDATSGRTKVQNPAPLEQKVANFDQMRSDIARIDRFNLTRTPNFEPRRGPTVPNFVAAAHAPVLFQPIKGGTEAHVLEWLAALDGVEDDALIRGFNQKELRQWKRNHRNHRAFTVIEHPVARLHNVFVLHILGPALTTYWDIRENLRKNYKLPLAPDGGVLDPATHKQAFLMFIKWVRGNLGGQTGVRVDGAWASQTEILRGFGQVQVPDMVLRADHLALGLGQIADLIGRDRPPVAPAVDLSPVPLAEIYDAQIEEAAKATYQKDYMMFGFGPWTPPEILTQAAE